MLSGIGLSAGWGFERIIFDIKLRPDEIRG
jgi:hypothetical protein